MITIYQYMPGWTVPCISPYVTKVIYYMRMTGLPFEAKAQNLARLDAETPHGKLPVIVDSDGASIADSNDIISHLKARHGDALDGGATPAELAQMLAFVRLIDDHLYWVAVIQPRWRETANWETYLRIIAGTNDVPPLRAFADDFRHRIVTEFMLGGWGRMPAEAIYRQARADIDALRDFLGTKPFLMGDQPRSVDAALLSILRHIVDTPFAFDTKDYAAAQPSLIAYMARMKDRFGI